MANDARLSARTVVVAWGPGENVVAKSILHQQAEDRTMTISNSPTRCTATRQRWSSEARQLRMIFPVVVVCAHAKDEPSAIDGACPGSRSVYISPSSIGYRQ